VYDRSSPLVCLISVSPSPASWDEDSRLSPVPSVPQKTSTHRPFAQRLTWRVFASRDVAFLEKKKKQIALVQHRCLSVFEACSCVSLSRVALVQYAARHPFSIRIVESGLDQGGRARHAYNPAVPGCSCVLRGPGNAPPFLLVIMVAFFQFRPGGSNVFVGLPAARRDGRPCPVLRGFVLFFWAHAFLVPSASGVNHLSSGFFLASPLYFARAVRSCISLGTPGSDHSPRGWRAPWV